jgi:hypothetical protein
LLLRQREDLEEERFVDLACVSLGRREEQLVRHRHQRPAVARGVLGQRLDHLERDELRVTRGGDDVPQELRQLARRRYVELDVGPNPALERQQVIGLELLKEAPVTGQDHEEQRSRVVIAARERAELIQHRRQHLLCFVDDDDRPDQGRVDVRLPLLTDRLESRPAIVRRERHAEQIAELAVEVRDAALGMLDRPHHDVT